MGVRSRKGVLMTTLVPRLWSDVAEWLEQDMVLRGGAIRLEDGISDTEYTVKAELPGLDPEKDVQVNVAHGLLTIHAERTEEKQTKHRTEFRYGVFERSVRLPANAEESKVKAHYGKGILEITVPLKAIPPATKKVAITTE
jgi:HSP20 family protein